jgi:ethanolamine utilization protein EutQ
MGSRAGSTIRYAALETVAMAERFVKQTKPFVVPTTDGKHIAEHFGRASTGETALSIAHMIAPPFWSEPVQRPEFD